MNRNSLSAPCPLCSRPGRGPLGPHSDFPGSSIYRCDDCSHGYCWPEPSFDELAGHYEKDYSAKRRMYFGDEYRWLMTRRAKAQSDLISRYASTGVAVDVGCGIGALVARLSSMGWNASGFDGDPAVVAYGKTALGANIEVGSMDTIRSAGRQVDLLCFSHVVEHFRDLVPTLRQMVGSVRPGGHVFVEVPNDVSIPAGDMESHLQFFSVASLGAALRAGGLNVVFCSGCGPLSQDMEPPAPMGFLPRAIRALRARAGRLLRRTPWDGWYDRYHPDGRGIWLRCIAQRPAVS